MIFRTEEIKTLVIGTLLSGLAASSFSEQSSSLSVVISIIYSLLCINKTSNERLCLLALAMPNTRVLEVAGISVSVLICVIDVLFSRKRKICTISKLFVFLCILYLLFSLNNIIRFGDIKYGLIMPIKMVCVLVYFYNLSIDKDYLEKSHILPLKASIFLLIGAVAAIIGTRYGNSVEGRWEVANNDANMLSNELAFCFSVFCVYYFKSKILSIKNFALLSLVAIILCLLCGSRMGILLIAIIMISSFLLNSRNASSSLLFAIIISGIAYLFINLSIGQDAISTFTQRWNALESQDDISNGRYFAWGQYIATLNQSYVLWLFGLGDYEQYGIELMAHNAIIEDLANYGIIGMFLLYSAIIIVYRNIIRNIQCPSKERTLFKLLPFFIPLFGGMTLHSWTSIINMTTLFLGMTIYSVSIRNSTNIYQYENSSN